MDPSDDVHLRVSLAMSCGPKQTSAAVSSVTVARTRFFGFARQHRHRRTKHENFPTRPFPRSLKTSRLVHTAPQNFLSNEDHELLHTSLSRPCRISPFCLFEFRIPRVQRSRRPRLSLHNAFPPNQPHTPSQRQHHRTTTNRRFTASLSLSLPAEPSNFESFPLYAHTKGRTS